MKKAKIAFLGAGNMARSIIIGLVKDDYAPDCIWAVDRNQYKLDALAQQYQINTSPDVDMVTELADIIILAVKPQSLEALADEISATVKKRHPLLISIAAGITLQTLENWFGAKAAIIRAMPNTPALLQAGATGLYANQNVSSQQRSFTESIMRAVGIVTWVKKEALIDAVIALAGSGPAYYFLFMEVMQQIGQEMGLDEKTSYLLTLQTAFGAAKLALETGEPLADLRKQVTSKGGTTEAALNSFQSGGIRELFKHAMEAARERNQALAQQFNSQRKIDNHS